MLFIADMRLYIESMNNLIYVNSEFHSRSLLSCLQDSQRLLQNAPACPTRARYPEKGQRACSAEPGAAYALYPRIVEYLVFRKKQDDKHDKSGGAKDKNPPKENARP